MAIKKKVTQAVQFDKEQFMMNINEPMLYLIQQLTGHPTIQIVSFFHDILHQQKKEIELTNAGNNPQNKYGRLSQKKSYGYYPGTKIYFTIVTSVSQKPYPDPNDKSYYPRHLGEYTLWTCNVSLPRGNVVYDHDELKKALAESILVGEAALAPIADPNIRKTGRRDDLAKLDTITDTTEDEERTEDV